MNVEGSDVAPHVFSMVSQVPSGWLSLAHIVIAQSAGQYVAKTLR